MAQKNAYSIMEIGSLEPGLESRSSYLSTWWDEAGEYYAPPANFDHLTHLLRINAHHESALFCKRNTVLLGYQPKSAAFVSRAVMRAVALDYLLYGNAYLRQRSNAAGRLLRLEHLHARVIRRKRENDSYCQVFPDRTIDFAPGEVIHIQMYAPESSIYGLPEYLGCVNSLLLNEQATLFRRKYYVNGAHMGFILFTQGQEFRDEDIEALQAKVAAVKGVGNFRSLHLHMDGEGKVELIPVGDFAKDDFERIKTISRDDIISAHRVPPQILSVLTDNRVAVAGDLNKIVELYNSNVVRPIQLDLTDEINHHLPQQAHIAFHPYTPFPDGNPERQIEGGTP